MPQMNPLPWLSLFLMFIFLLMMIQSMIHFSFFPKTMICMPKKTTKNFNWKW
uniref:ATP synthase complex subunit 8 n=1 Tax=Dorypteryx domestica TaxID=209979 RepID=A0A343QC98_9NEOP|nr:ATP synthase F0 subunit 8 [Dorypteryx domestica]ATU07045.1 ATP synthase F0 subunit 8 [Dorypteryx domestica]